MNNTKENKARRWIFLSSLWIVLVLTAEMFLNTYFRELSIVLGLVLLITAFIAVWVLVRSILNLETAREEKIMEHLENLYKSEKASYLMMKSRFQELEEKLAVIQQNSKIPSEEIINAQKGIAKVIINRSKENADAIINSNDQLLERLDELEEVQNSKFTGISKEQRLKLTEMTNQTELKLQDMVVQLKDMELRLNQSIMQGGGRLPAASDLGESIVLPEQEELQVEEEVPPMPDLSDPNRSLSPDEIAALIANL